MLGFLWIRQVWYALHAHARLRDTAFQQESVRSGSVGTASLGTLFFATSNPRISARVAVGIVITVYAEGLILSGVGCCLFRMH